MLSQIAIPGQIYDAMIAHARRELPNECCGFLAGSAGVISEHYPLRNELASPCEYNADPRSLFEAHRAMHRNGSELIAIYHSHPTSIARPSRVDLAKNYWGDMPQIIISCLAEPFDVRAFRLHEHHFEELQCERVAG